MITQRGAFSHFLLTSLIKLFLLLTTPQGATPKVTSLGPMPPVVKACSFTASPTNSITPVFVPPVIIQAPSNNKQQTRYRHGFLVVLLGWSLPPKTGHPPPPKKNPTLAETLPNHSQFPSKTLTVSPQAREFDLIGSMSRACWDAG